MLIKTDIFTTPSPQNQEKNVISSGNHPNRNSLISSHEPKIMRQKRDFLDIFSPYSLGDLSKTANENYKAINRNFLTIHIDEKRLNLAQARLAGKIVQINSNEKALLKKELYLELRNLQNTFIS